MSRENHLLRTNSWPGNYWHTKKLDWDYSTTGITSYTHHKNIHYTPEKPFECTNVAKGSETNFIYINIIRPPAKTKWKYFDALFVENVFKKSKSLGSRMAISIKTLNGSLVNLVVKSLGKSAHWAFILKSNTLILTCLFRNGVVRYARNHIPFKSPKRTHKVGS